MKKRLVLLSIFMAAGILFGCGQNKTADEKKETQTEVTEGEASEPEEGEAIAEDEQLAEENTELIGGLFEDSAVYAVRANQTVEQIFQCEGTDKYISSLVCDANTIFFAESAYDYSLGNSIYHIYQCEDGKEPVDLFGELIFSGVDLRIKDGKLCPWVTLNADDDYKMVEICYEKTGDAYEETSRRDLTDEEKESLNTYAKYNDFEMEHNLTVLKEIDENTVFFATKNDSSNTLDHTIVYRYNPNTGDLTECYSCDEVAGIPRIPTKGSGIFEVIDGFAYFRDTDGKTTYWCRVDLNDTAKGKEKLSGCELSYEHMQKGTVTYEYEEKKCDDCDMVLTAVYVEKYQLNADQPNADKINATLDGYAAQRLQSSLDGMMEPSEEEIQDMHNSEYSMSYSSTLQVDEMQTLGHYIQITFSGYDYMGGAHGYPIRDYLLFDTNTGEQLSFADLYKGDEESFKKIVADYSLALYQDGNKGFFEMDTDADFWQMIHDDVDVNHAMYFSKDGIVILYSPYEYGPYAAGYIEVEIPYNEFAIDLNQ